MWPFKKKQPEPPVEYTITSVVYYDNVDRWRIRYEGNGEVYENMLHRVHFNGRVAPEPQVGDTVRRVSQPMMYSRPNLWLYVNGYSHLVY